MGLQINLNKLIRQWRATLNVLLDLDPGPHRCAGSDDTGRDA
jgi:hypothetical protein